MKRHRTSKYIYAAYERGGEELCIANADSAAELADMLHVTKAAILHKLNGISDQSRSKYIVMRFEA